MIFTNGATGQTLDAIFREARPEDADAAIACLRTEYGDRYFAQALYEPGYARHAMETGELLFQLAVLEDGSAAAVINTWFFKHFDNIASFGALVVRPDCRRFGLSGPFTQYGFDVAKKSGAAALYVYPYTRHTITQKSTMALGFAPCGFEFQRADNSTLAYSFDKGTNVKSICGLGVLALEKQAPDRVNVPESLAALTRKIYLQSGAEPEIVSRGEPESDMFRFAISEHNRCASVYVEAGGAGLGRAVMGTVGAYADWPTLTVNAYVNITRASAVPCMESLLGEGFFFAGLLPISGDGALAVLHHPMRTEPNFQDIRVTGFYEELLADIKSLYVRRHKP